MTDVERAKALLAEGHTCVAVCGDSVYTSDRKGIAPLIGWIGQNVDLTGYSVADKIAGRAAAMMYVKTGIVRVHVGVLSRGGLTILHEHGIAVTYDTLTERIINREGTGDCPMEEAVRNESDPDRAYLLILAKLESLHNR